MSNPPIAGYPNRGQTQYARLSKAPLTGELWEEEHWNARPLNAVLPFLDAVPFVKTFTIGANSPGDVVGIDVDGGIIAVPSGVDATATALALSNAILAAGFASTYFASSVPSAAVITVGGQLGQDPTITPVEEGATTLTIASVTDATVQPLVCFGEGVVRYDDGTGINTDKFVRPSALTDKFIGVLLRTTGAKIPAGQLAESGLVPTPSVDYALPGQAYSIEREDVGVVVDYVGDAPGVLDSVFLIMVGADAGKWAKSDGAGSQVVILTATSVADGNIGFGLNGLAPLSLTATANATADATALFALLVADPGYRALFTDYTTDAVDNLDGTLTLTFAPGLAPAFVDASTGTSAVAQVIDTAAVAANALAIPEYSWGKPSIVASAEEPARAFLRLSRS